MDRCRRYRVVTRSPLMRPLFDDGVVRVRARGSDEVLWTLTTGARTGRGTGERAATPGRPSRHPSSRRAARPLPGRRLLVRASMSRWRRRYRPVASGLLGRSTPAKGRSGFLLGPRTESALACPPCRQVGSAPWRRQQAPAGESRPHRRPGARMQRCSQTEAPRRP